MQNTYKMDVNSQLIINKSFKFLFHFLLLIIVFLCHQQKLRNEINNLFWVNADRY